MRFLPPWLICLGFLVFAGCRDLPPDSDMPELREREGKTYSGLEGKEPRARNLILLIGDGMGESHRRAARWMKAGPKGRLAMDEMPVHGKLKTASAGSATTDSAAATTAMATGVKTFNRIVGLGPDYNRLETILEIALRLGKAAGLVTTTQLYHATPASFAAHVPSRNDHAQIAAQMMQQGIAVLLGGGENGFLPTNETGCHPEQGFRRDNVNLVDLAVDEGYTHICTAAALDAIDPEATDKLLGLFADRGMVRPFSPSLPEMTEKAIAILSRDPDGFFLMVEGGQIDWASHANDAVNAIGDTIEFDEAVAVAFRFAEQNRETLVIVTADHETGGMSLSLKPGRQQAKDSPFTMPDGTVFYVQWTTKGHTSAPVPISAQGPGSAMARNATEHTHVYNMMLRLMR